MPQLPYNCSIDALVPIALFNKEQKELREKQEQERQDELRSKRILSLDNIFADICTVFEVAVEKCKTRTRFTEYIICRKIFCYVAKKKTGFSYKQIAEFIGGRDHTTAIHHTRKVEGFLKVKDPDFLADWKRFLENSSLFNQNDFK